MNTKLIAFASALAATVALTSAAEAGGGVRLGFGVPLGSFVATPAPGGSSYHASRLDKAPAHAARKPQKPAPRIAKAEPSKELPKPAANGETDAGSGSPSQGQAPVTGSSALIQGAIPLEQAAVDQKAAEVSGSAEAPAGGNAGATPEPAVTAGTGKAPDGSESCRKFIPAVGMTVAVGCE